MAQKLEKATKKYMKVVDEVHEEFQQLPTHITREYLLEDRFFKHVPQIAISCMKLELLSSYLVQEEGE